MKKELTINIAVLGTVLLSMIACNTNNTATVDDRSKDTSKVINQAATTANTNTAADALPDLLEIGATIKNSGLKFIPGLTNPVNDVSQYNTAFDKEINMGIYFADLSYCTLNKQNQKSIGYLKAVKTIADDIGIGQIFGSGTFAQRYQANLDNADSLAAIVADMQAKADNMLKGGMKRNDMRSVIYSGAWIENMYIGAKVNTQSKNNDAGFQVVEQMTLLDNILKVLDGYRSVDQHYQDLYTDLKQIADIYRAFDEVKNYNPNNQKASALTDEHAKKLTELLEALHSKYIK
jgi:hypothetical protein